MPRKFALGDKARIAPERIPRYYPDWIRVGRVVTIAAVVPGAHNEHCYYRIHGNRRRESADFLFRSDDLRRLGEPDLRSQPPKPFPGRPRSSQGVTSNHA